MRTKTVNLDPDTREVLLRSRIDGNNLFLPGQLERSAYQKVAKAIEAAGGKWNKKAGCHVFPHDVRETLNITDESVKVVNVQQTFQAFYTPAEVARQMMQWAGEVAGMTVLEPSAGSGNLVRAIFNHATGADNVRLTAIDVNPKCVAMLEDQRRKTVYANTATFRIECADFLTCIPEGLGLFHRVIMNPPFSEGDDIKHILHARKFLRPKGRIVAICGAGTKQREALEPIAIKWIDIPAGAFKESGTNVATAIVVIEN